jgi:hypothetical protein
MMTVDASTHAQAMTPTGNSSLLAAAWVPRIATVAALPMHGVQQQEGNLEPWRALPMSDNSWLQVSSTGSTSACVYREH